jgi:hypothetical protein
MKRVIPRTNLRILTFPYLVVLLGAQEMIDPEVPATWSPVPALHN